MTLAGVSGPTLVPPSIPSMSESLGVSPTSGALILSIYTLPGVIAAPVIGYLADRYGRKAVMTPALVLHGLAGGACMFAPDFKILLMLRLLQGIGSAGLVNLVVVTLGDLLEGITRTRYIGYNAAVLTVGTTSFPTLGGMLASRNWRHAYLPYWGVLGVALGIAVLLPNTKGSIRSSPTVQRNGSLMGESRKRESFPKGFIANVAEVLSLPALRRLMLRGFVLFLLIFGGIMAAVPVMLKERFHASALTIGAFLTAGSVLSMIMSSNGGRLQQRVGFVNILLMGFLAYSAGMLGLAIASEAGSRLLALAAIAMCGAGEGMSIVVLQARATEVAPPGLRGTSVAMFVSSARLGQTTGPVVAKVGLDRLGFISCFFAFAGIAALMSLEQARVITRIKSSDIEQTQTAKSVRNQGEVQSGET